MLEPRSDLLRQFRQSFLHFLDPVSGYLERQQIRIWKIAVILRVFLASHRARFTLFRIEEARLLLYGPSVFEDFDLPPGLVIDRLLETTERVEVLYFTAGTKDR